jgi:FG-GAP repeat
MRSSLLLALLVCAVSSLATASDDSGVPQLSPLLNTSGNSQLAKLTASSDSPSGGLGGSVAVSGDLVVVGAANTPIGHNRGQGAVYVFRKPADGWSNATQIAVLTASDGKVNDFLGGAVAISGDTIVAGAYSANIFVGAVYVFVKPAGGWSNMTQTAKLTSSDLLANANLGWSVAIDHDTIVAGAPGLVWDGLPCRVYVYVRPANGWTDTAETAEFAVAPNGSGFGASVAVHDETIVVSATGLSQGNYVFVRPEEGWKTTSEYTALLSGSNGICCSVVAMNGQTVVAAVGGKERTVYVFSKPVGGWVSSTETARLNGAGGSGERLNSVSINSSGTAILAGTLTGILPKSGSAYLYLEPVGGWVTASRSDEELRASDEAARDEFGGSVGMGEHYAVVGSWGAQVVGKQASGAAYVFGNE